jgi:hypothetical protein
MEESYLIGRYSYKDVCDRLARAEFTIGYLTGELKNHLSLDSVNQVLSEAREKAEKIFGKEKQNGNSGLENVGGIGK